MGKRQFKNNYIPPRNAYMLIYELNMYVYILIKIEIATLS